MLGDKKQKVLVWSSIILAVAFISILAWALYSYFSTKGDTTYTPLPAGSTSPTPSGGGNSSTSSSGIVIPAGSSTSLTPLPISSQYIDAIRQTPVAVYVPTESSSLPIYITASSSPSICPLGVNKVGQKLFTCNGGVINGMTVANQTNFGGNVFSYDIPILCKSDANCSSTELCSLSPYTNWNFVSESDVLTGGDPTMLGMCLPASSTLGVQTIGQEYIRGLMNGPKAYAGVLIVSSSSYTDFPLTMLPGSVTGSASVVAGSLIPQTKYQRHAILCSSTNDCPTGMSCQPYVWTAAGDSTLPQGMCLPIVSSMGV